MFKQIFCGVCLSLAFSNPSFAEPNTEAEKSPIGQQVKNFTLKDYRGKTHELSDYKSKALVIAYLGTECPLAKLYAPRLTELEKSYASKGVKFLAINANRQDSLTEIASYAQRHNVSFPILKDLGNNVADEMGAVRTPEVFLLDKNLTVRYWGRIDDQYGIGYIREEARRHDLKIAIDEVLSGKEVSQPTHAAVGCFIGRMHEVKTDSKVTYSNQIARIFQERCVECHRTGEIAPFALTNYEEVAGWAETIAEVIQEQRMPPWHANPKHGEFVNARRLTSGEKRLIYDWVDAGAPEGDPKNLPEPKTYQTGWQLPKDPDLVIPMRNKPYEVPAEGTVRYQYFQVDTNFTEDKWIKAAEVIPGNRAVVHHVLVMVRGAEGAGRTGVGGIRQEFLTAYVPGLRARPLPEGMAKRIPKGSRLIFQVHYTPIGTPQKDLSKIGLVFADPQEVEHIVLTTQTANGNIKIPPHAENHRVESTSRSLPTEMKLIGMSPHMHLRGKAFSYEAIYPGGRKETLLDVPHYDFNWQTEYRLKELKTLPAGTRIHCVAHFDNSEYNLANPNPEKTVTWGDQTWDEMMIGYFHVAIPVSQADQLNKAETARTEKEAKATTRARRTILQFDANSDGKISTKEVPPRLGIIFAGLDTNKDSYVTLEELTIGIRKFQKTQEKKKE